MLVENHMFGKLFVLVSFEINLFHVYSTGFVFWLQYIFTPLHVLVTIVNFLWRSLNCCHLKQD